MFEDFESQQDENEDFAAINLSDLMLEPLSDVITEEDERFSELDSLLLFNKLNFKTYNSVA